MGLRIVSEELQSGAKPESSLDDYISRLRKYVPAETVSFWLLVSSMIKSAEDDVPKVGLLWLLFIIGLVLTYLGTRQRTSEPEKPTAWTQIGISCGAFIVWVFGTGELFSAWAFYKPLYGSLLLVTYTAFVAIIVPPEK